MLIFKFGTRVVQKNGTREWILNLCTSTIYFFWVQIKSLICSLGNLLEKIKLVIR
jgi:hypothetical protein